MAQAPPCPYCGASSYQLQDQRWLQCKSCGHEFDIRTDLCLACGRLNREGETICAYCQAGLRRDAAQETIAERSKDRGAYRAEHTQTALQQKKAEEEASRQRLEAYWARERARREAAARAALEQRQRQRKLLIVVGLLSALFVLLLVAVALLLIQSTQTPVGAVDVPRALDVVRAPQGIHAAGGIALLRLYPQARVVGSAPA